MYAFSDVEDFDDESSSFSCYLCDAGFKLLDDNLVYLVLVSKFQNFKAKRCIGVLNENFMDLLIW